MSYVADPMQLAQPPVLISDNEDDEEEYDPEDKFWEEYKPGNRYVSNHMGIHVDYCRFDDSGKHIHMSDNCPHFREYDETGRNIKPGWTVQQR